MVVDASVGHVATKDVSKLVLIGARDMRVRWLVLEFDAVRLGASHDVLLLSDRQSFPISYLVLPLLQQQDGAGSTGNSFGQECVHGSFEQRRILRAINEAGKIAIVPIRPARGLFPSEAWPTRSWMTDRAICRGELLAFLRVQNVQLQVRM